MKTILLVGGAGYIGAQCAKLLSKHYRTVVLDDLCMGHKEAVLFSDFEQVSLSDKKSLEHVFEKYNIDVVCHFAAHTQVEESMYHPDKYYQNNVVGTLNLLDVMKENNVKKIVFSSTCATYGNPKYIPLDEKHTQNPINTYGMSKYIDEQMIKDYARSYGLQYTIFRYFNAAGCDPDGQLGCSQIPETHVIPIILQTLTGQRKVFKIFGDDYDTSDGSCIRDYIHVCDLAQAHLKAIQKMENSTENFELNLGTGKGYSVKQLVAGVEKVTGQKVPVQIAPRRAGDPACLYADSSLAFEKIGWKAEITDIDEMIKTAWIWEQDRKY